MKTSKTYLISHLDARGEWSPVLDWANGLLQSIHYSRKDEAIKRAKKYSVHSSIRVTQQALQAHDLGDGDCIRIVYERKGAT